MFFFTHTLWLAEKLCDAFMMSKTVMCMCVNVINCIVDLCSNTIHFDSDSGLYHESTHTLTHGHIRSTQKHTIHVHTYI